MSALCILGITVLVAAVFVGGCTTPASQVPTAQVQVNSTSSSLPQAAANAVYPAATLNASGGIGVFAWAITQGTLPTGLALSSTGVVSGTPTQSGAFTFTVTATDEQGHSASANLTVTINPSITSVTTTSGSVGGGATTTGTVTLASAALFAAPVALASNNAVASVPATVTVAAGATTANFTITTTAVAASTQVTITATYGPAKTTTLIVNPAAALSVNLTNSPLYFSQGDTGDTYKLTVSNPAGGVPTSGAVTVTEIPSSGLTVTAMAGGGGSLWVCTLGTLSCTRSDVLAAGASYDAITVTVSVALNASASQLNEAKVSGGGSATTTGLDSTTVFVPNLTITKTHTGSFQAGQTGAKYTLTVFNLGGTTGNSTGAVTVTEIPPAGLTVTGMSGGGGSLWVCTLGTLSCTRSDRLNSGSNYDPITVTVNVSGSAPASLTNQASVSGGNSATPPNASDLTAIVIPSLSITKKHSGGNFTLGEQGAAYTITVTNGTGASAPTSGTITVVDTPPTGFTVTAIAGVGGGTPWSCVLGTLTCTSTRALAGGESDPITVTGNVSLSATAPFQNTATLSGGGGTAPAPAVDTMSVLNAQLQITTTNATLPSGTDGIAYSANLAATGGSGGYTWSYTGGTNLTAASLTLSSGGLISGTPGATGGFPFSVQVQDSQGNTQTASLTLNVSAGTLAITTGTNSLPSDTVNVAYPSSISLAASGGITPYTWSLVSASTTFPTGMTLGSNGAITGTPTVAGPFTFTVKVTDSTTPTAMTQQATLTITINPVFACPMTALGNEASLSGSYAAQFNGFQDANGPFQATAIFAANGSGGITGGEGDFGAVLNYTSGSYANPVAPANLSITGGCYQLGSDNRGAMIWTFTGGDSVTFAISVRDDGTLGRIIEFDDAAPSATGVKTRGAGFFQKQTITGPFNLASFDGPFALGLSGYNNDECTGSTQTGCTSSDSGYQRLASVGTFTSNGTGGLTGFTFDVAQANGHPGAQQNVDGVTTTTSTYTAPDSLGRGTFSIAGTNAGLGGAFSIDYSYYLIDATHAYIQSIDAPNQVPLFNGEVIGQSGSFSGASLNGSAFFSMTGGDVAANSFSANAAGQVTGNGSGTSVSALVDQIVDGTAVSAGTTAITGGTFTATSNGMGVLTIGSGGTAKAFSVAMYAANGGFIMEGTQAAPGSNIMEGLMQPQSGGFGTLAGSGIYSEGSGVPADTNTTVEAGTVTLTPGATPSPTVIGTNDQSGGLNCSACLVTANPINGTYSIDANGRITVTTSGGTIFGWMRDSSHGVLLYNGSNDVMIVLDQEPSI
jgi:hypothetical protein